MHHRSRSQKKRSIPIEKILFFVSIAFLLSCVILAVKRHSLVSDGDVEASSGGRTDPGAPAAAGGLAVAEGERKDGDDEIDAARRAQWPKIDRVARLRFGVVQDVADAFALGKYSGLVSLDTESEQLLFEGWCARAAAWSEPWNRDPVLFADGENREGARVYRVQLHGQELGRLHMKRYANGWNIIGVERKVTEADILAEQRILDEAAARAGIVRHEGVKAAKTSGSIHEESEKRDP